MSKTFYYLVALLLGLCVVAGGCGSSTPSGSSSSELASVTPKGSARNKGQSGSKRQTKAVFIKEADDICEQADSKQTAEIKEHARKGADEREQEDLIRDFALPPIAEEVAELRELRPPSGEEGAVDLILSGIEDALKKAEADPASVIAATTGPFVEIEKAASRYGFKACNAPA
jgi:hypothetical protein